MRKVISGAFTVAVIAVFLFLLFVALTRAQSNSVVATGGPYTLEKTVIAGGGGQKQIAPVNENGTVGQAVAGQSSSGGPFIVYSGFWTPDALVPTAANVGVGGRVTDHSGTGIRNVTVTLTSQSGGIRKALSSSFGYYMFEGIEAGQTYMISVTSGRYTFPEPVRVIHVGDEITNADFVANPRL